MLPRPCHCVQLYGCIQALTPAENFSLEKSEVWSTDNNNFDRWIFQLMYCMIAIRLCQNIAILKAEIAELLFPSVIGTNINLHELITSQVKEHIFIDSNKLTKSKQIMLNTLNELRMCYVLERSTFSGQTKREKNTKHSSAAKIRDVETSSNGMAAPITAKWDKVYWLSIDYLVVARSAVVCGAYLTASMYVEYWCEEKFGSLSLGDPDFSYHDKLPDHVEILVSAITRINEPDSLYGVIHSNKLSAQIITFEHEGNWTRALEYYDLQARSQKMIMPGRLSEDPVVEHFQQTTSAQHSVFGEGEVQRQPFKGLIRSLQQTGCMHVLDLYCRGLTSREGCFQYDPEFIELQYEAAWRAGKWDFSLLYPQTHCQPLQHVKNNSYHENLHCCLRALQEGDCDGFYGKLKDAKKELVLSISRASEESTDFIYSTVVKLQILYHLGLVWDLRWMSSAHQSVHGYPVKQMACTDPMIPTMEQLSWLNKDWSSIITQTQLHMNLLEPFMAFRRVLLQILGCEECSLQHSLQSASLLRKGSRFSHAAAFLHEFKFLCARSDGQQPFPDWLGKLEETKFLHAQGRYEVAISLIKHGEQSKSSVQLLGVMAFCAPRQPSQCIPRVVPKLTEIATNPLDELLVLSDLLSVTGDIRLEPVTQIILWIIKLLSYLLQRLKDLIVWTSKLMDCSCHILFASSKHSWYWKNRCCLEVFARLPHDCQ